MSEMTTLEAINWVAQNPNNVGDAVGQLMISERGMAEYPVGSEAYNMHKQTYDYHMGRISDARDEAAAEQAIMDIEQNKATCDCQPGEPCCFKSGEVWDSTKASRKVTWPTTNGESRIFVVAKDVEGTSLVAKVKSKLNPEKPCTAVNPIDRGINTDNPLADRNPLAESETEVRVPAPRTPNYQSLGQGLLPGDFVMAMVAIDTIMAAGHAFSDETTVNYTPEMCQFEKGMGETLKVQAVPQMELNGEVSAFLKLGIHTSGLSAGTGLNGEIKGKVGDRTVEIKGHATAETLPPAGRPIAPMPENSSKKGNIGFVENILGKLTAFAAKGDPKVAPPRTTSDLVDPVTGSGVELKMTIKLGTKALELKPVDASPDLELLMSQFEASISLKVTGIIDLIELAVAIILSPAGARTVQRARAAAAKGEVVRGEAKCEVKLSAEGELSQKYDSGFSYLCSANAESGFKRGESAGTFGGKVTVTGNATISIHVEAQLWIAQAQAGARGAIHTAWVWEMQKNDGKRQKRYQFEGLRARAVAYAEIGLVQDDSAPIGTVDPNQGRSNTPSDGLSSDVSASGTQVLGRVGGPQKDNWSEPAEGEKVILEPSVPYGTDPPWEDY